MPRRNRTLPAAIFLSLSLLVPVSHYAAETGDFDGDGRLSIGDVLHHRDGKPLAPGSTLGFETRQCFLSSLFQRSTMPGAVYLESLRRQVDDPRPDWLGVWPARTRSEPLPADERVVVRLSEAVAQGGDNDRVQLEIGLTSFVPIAAFSFVLEADVPELLRPVYIAGGLWEGYREWSELFANYKDEFEHSGGDYPVWVPTPAYFASGGRLVVKYGLTRGRRAEVIEIGQARFVVDARLPKGTSAGRYDLRILPGSEMLLEDGTLLSPLFEDAEEGELQVLEDVTAGWDEGIPPIRVDEAERRVVGKVEFRVTSGEGFPGETIPLRVQMRTEVPLNKIEYRVDWPPGDLVCAGDGSVLFTNPEDGRRYREERAYCFDLRSSGSALHSAVFYLAGYNELLGSLPPFELVSYPERLLEYFKPLGQWVDVSEFSVTIPEGAEGGKEIPLRFFRWSYERQHDLGAAAVFRPFAVNWTPCHEEDPDHADWTYDVSYEDGVVRVLGANEPGEPPPPVDAGVRILLGDASGAPGEVVEVPVFASTAEPLSILRIALESDDGVVDVGAIDAEVRSLRTRETARLVVARGTPGVFTDCIGEGLAQECWHGVPLTVFFQESEPRYTVIDLRSSNDGSHDYPGGELREIARLRVRIKETAATHETVLRVGRAVFSRSARFPVETEAGGFLFPEQEVFARATETRNAVITIDGAGRSFVRGDANLDGEVNLSDAVFSLEHLFGGGSPPGCEDSADADDSGEVNLTDAVFLLGALFEGRGGLPEPYPECGHDGTEDTLECRRDGCAP